MLVFVLDPLQQVVHDLLNLISPAHSKLLFQQHVRQFCERVSKTTDYDDLILYLADQIPILFDARLVSLYVLDDNEQYLDLAWKSRSSLPNVRTINDDFIVEVNSVSRAFVRQSELIVPLTKNGTLEGIAILENRADGREYDPLELAIADSVSFQIANALTSAKYGRFLGRNLAYLSSLTMFSKTVRSAMDLHHLVKIVEPFLSTQIGIEAPLFFAKSKTGLRWIEPLDGQRWSTSTEFQISAEELDALSEEMPYLTAFNFIIRPETTAPLQGVFKERFGQFESRELKFIPLIYQQEIIGGIWFCLRNNVSLNRKLLYAVIPEIAVTLRNIQMYRGVLDQQYLGKQTIDSIHDGIVVVDDRKQIFQYNRAADAALGLSLVHVDDRNVDYLERYIPGLATEFTRFSGSSGVGREINLVRSGKKRPLRVSVSSIVLQPNGQVGWMLHMSELTQIQALNRQMTQSRRFSTLGRLATIISRDIHQSLASILQVVQQIDTRYELTEFETEFTNQVLFGLERLEKLAETLESIGEAQPPVTEAVRLSVVIENTLKLLSNELDQKQVQVRFDRDQIPVVIGNSRQLELVFFYLILNATQALPAGLPDRMVTISTAKADGKVQISISDTGAGISLAGISDLFDPFSVVRKSGTGLELYAVQSIIAAHGSKLVVESVRNQGTTVTFSLPLARIDQQVFTVTIKSTAVAPAV